MEGRKIEGKVARCGREENEKGEDRSDRSKGKMEGGG